MDRASAESSCLPTTYRANRADMGTVGTTQLCWTILGFLLLQGHNSQPMTTQTANPQGTFSKLSLTIKSTSNTAPPTKVSQVPMVTSESTMPRSSIVDDHSSSSLSLPQSQPQKHTSRLGTGAPHSSRSSGSPSGDTSQNITPKTTTVNTRTEEYLTIRPSPTSESVLTVAAFGVISFIVILVVVVIILVSVVSLRFKCQKNKESEDPQKPGSSGISESCSTANGEKDSITLISMKNINTNNSKRCSSAEKVL